VAQPQRTLSIRATVITLIVLAITGTILIWTSGDWRSGLVLAGLAISWGAVWFVLHGVTRRPKSD
jgi:hypothetical protein